MSLDYNFSIATGLRPQQVLRIALDELGLKPETVLLAEGVFKETAGPGFTVSAGPMSPLARTILEEELKLSPSVDLQFWVDKGEQRHEALTAILRSVLAVLHHVPGDAVLLFIGETVHLLRRDGQLYLNGRTGLWRPERLKRVNMPYTLKDFPVL
ncbi:hypothetical protein SAMN05444354_113153 [Stigmatella aurantiaca]|uniref:Uncharacterized protein n=1 Tax=Stigmatella aurantiaca TaxID=41 RepID=A0A1H7WRH6_STIAU|nr:SitI3 family protein [Stigmatella aurantiaca]SEM24180.1 hypothetical protein SAMN05444354_113153 [Stigmatella aurantiaca]